MKSISRILTTAFIFFLTLIYIQGQTEYRRANINISIPAVIEQVKKTLRFETGNVMEDHKELHISVGFYANLDDMQLNGNKFSGIKITSYPISEEIVIFSGVLSEDQHKIESISIDYQYVKYHVPDRSKARIEEKKKGSFTFKNIPKKFTSYSFNFEVSEIMEAKWETYKYLKYRAISETTVSRLIKVNEEKITKWTQCLRIGMKPTNYTTEKPVYNKKLAVVTEGCETSGEVAKECGPILGIHALLVARFSKVPGLKVLERQNIDLIKQEQELSGSGLVDPDSKVASGKIIDEDILVIIQLQEPISDDPADSWYYKLLIKVKETGELIDTGLSYRASPNNRGFEEFAMSAYAYIMKNYLM